MSLKDIKERMLSQEQRLGQSPDRIRKEVREEYNDMKVSLAALLTQASDCKGKLEDLFIKSNALEVGPATQVGLKEEAEAVGDDIADAQRDLNNFTREVANAIASIEKVDKTL